MIINTLTELTEDFCDAAVVHRRASRSSLITSEALTYLQTYLCFNYNQMLRWN